MNFIFFTEKAVLDYLARYGRGMQSKDYELVVAVLLKRFCEKQWGVDCLIGFQLQERFSRDIPDRVRANLDRIATILQKNIEEGTPIDVAIIKKSESPHKSRGPAFQLKRLRGDTSESISYLNSLYRKYSRTSTTLLVVFESDHDIGLRQIQQELDTAKFPFERLMFMSLSDGKLCIGEIWPKSGMETYDPQSFMGL